LILPGFDENSINEVVIMFWIISPTITIRAINQFHEYVWQYNERYERVAASNILPSVGILITLFIGKDYLGVYSLPVGFLISHLAMLILLATGVGYHYRFYLTFKDKYIKQIFFNSSIMMTSGLITKFRTIIQHYYSSKLEAGAISALSIADRICMPLRQRATVGIKMVVFTKSAKAVAAGDTSEFGKLYNNTMVVISLLMVPIVTWIGLNSETIIRVLFMRGQFTEEMNFLVSIALIGLIPSVIFLGMIPILLNAFYVLDKIYIPALVGPAATMVYVVALWQLTQKYGVFGVAISTSLMSFFQFIVLVIILNKELKAFSVLMVLMKFMLYVLVSGIAFGTTAFFTHHLFIHATIELFLSLFTGFFIYFILLWMFKEKGFVYTKKQVLSLVKKYN
jgi:putative peptidoglycan lipid II flippase